VFAGLRVAVLSTGDELVEPGQPLGAGQIYNSNRQLLISWLQRLGCQVLDAGILPDDLPATRAALAGLQDAELILSTGGVSVGEADFLGDALREQGELALWKLAIKPGKPLTFGHFRGCAGDRPAGQSGVHAGDLRHAGRPYILRRMGAREVEPLAFEVPAGFSWNKPGSRREYLRAKPAGRPCGALSKPEFRGVAQRGLGGWTGRSA
jgi:molybdopterin molybdotransferase